MSSTMLLRAQRFLMAGLVICAVAETPAVAADPTHPAMPIRIGEINSYATAPGFALPYRNGWQLAVEEINAAGGVDGRPLEVLSRDDGGRRSQAVQLAQELILKDRVDALAGTYLSDIGLAVSNVAAQQHKLFLAGAPLSDSLTWDKGNRYTFRLRPSTFMQASMLAEEAAKLPATRWAILAPNYEYGQSAAASFRLLLKARRPDVYFVAEQWPALHKIDAPAAVQALQKARPQALFNATFGADLAAFVAAGEQAHLFAGLSVVSMLGGEPENLAAFDAGNSAGNGAGRVHVKGANDGGGNAGGGKDGSGPGRGWLVSGYPVEQMDTPAQARFIGAYQARYHAAPSLGSLVGYMMIQSLAAAVHAAGSTDAEALVTAMRNLQLATPVGTIHYRALDQQSTMGTWIGRLDWRDGHARIRDWHYADGRAYLPPDSWVRSQRPGAAMR